MREGVVGNGEYTLKERVFSAQIAVLSCGVVFHQKPFGESKRFDAILDVHHAPSTHDSPNHSACTFHEAFGM